jgi:hypothetical protein
MNALQGLNKAVYEEHVDYSGKLVTEKHKLSLVKRPRAVSATLDPCTVAAHNAFCLYDLLILH